MKKTSIYGLLPKAGKELIKFEGKKIINTVGIDNIRDIIYSVLCGQNIRDLTESLTRSRLALSNAALLKLFVKGSKEDPNFIDNLAIEAHRQYIESKNPEERNLLQWILGLTNKGIQNVIRDNKENLRIYVDKYKNNICNSAQACKDNLGNLIGEIEIDSEKTSFSWETSLLFLSAIGAQTLAIRGSEKSAYGKLFERLIMGSLLNILGFKQIDPRTSTECNKVFWLSQRENKRESDATLLYKPGTGIRFDIGFIGPGNPEISLDKVTRFERTMDYAHKNHFMATFIIVDRIGEGSRITQMAETIEGTIIQMSMSYWPKLVAQKLYEKIKFRHPILKMQDSDIKVFLKKEIYKIEMSDFI